MVIGDLERGLLEDRLRYEIMNGGRRLSEKLFPDTVVPPQYFIGVISRYMENYFARFLEEVDKGPMIPRDIISYEGLTKIVLNLSCRSYEGKGNFFLEGKRRVDTPEGSMIPLHIISVISPAAVSNIYVGEVASISFGLDRRKGIR